MKQDSLVDLGYVKMYIKHSIEDIGCNDLTNVNFVLKRSLELIENIVNRENKAKVIKNKVD